jgi:hypothetical protein
MFAFFPEPSGNAANIRAEFIKQIRLSLVER